MRFLLDTHALLWALVDSQRLSSRAATLLMDPANAVLVSAVSAWEIASKHRLGRLAGAEPVVVGYAAHLQMLGARELPITSAQALLAGSFNVSHRDPFDRLLAAQALLEGVPLMTDDRAFTAFADLRTIW